MGENSKTKFFNRAASFLKAKFNAGAFDTPVRLTATFMIISGVLKLFPSNKLVAVQEESVIAQSPDTTHITAEMVAKIAADTSSRTYIGPATQVQIEVEPKTQNLAGQKGLGN